MGYDTRFFGQFVLDKQLTLDQVNQIRDYAEDPSSIPGHRPDCYLQWIPTRDGRGIKFDDESEKFYFYGAWLQWLIDACLKPWGIGISGEVRWQGEDRSDTGILYVDGDRVKSRPIELSTSAARAEAIVSVLSRRPFRVEWNDDERDDAINAIVEILNRPAECARPVNNQRTGL